MNTTQRGFEFLQAGDAEGLRHFLEQDPSAADERATLTGSAC